MEKHIGPDKESILPDVLLPHAEVDIETGLGKIPN